LRQAKVALAFLLGVRAAVPDYDVADEPLARREPEPLADASADRLIGMALAWRADLAAAEAQRARAAVSLRLAERERLPDVALAAQYTREGTGQSAIQPPTTAFSLSFAVPVFYQRQGEIAVARADLRTQELLQARATAQVVADVEAALSAVHGARRRIERMDSRLMERTRRARDLVQLQYETGAASLLELLDAQRTLIAAGVERVQVLDEYWTAVFQLEEAVGMELHE
jgi:outer membrane protein, heavy metal efflux system